MNKPVVLKNREYALWEKQIQMATKDVERISEAICLEYTRSFYMHSLPRMLSS